MKFGSIVIKFIVMAMGCCAVQAVFSAPNYLEQLPFANQTDPDHHRPNGWCNDDNACPPGWYCSSFGYCERR